MRTFIVTLNSEELKKMHYQYKLTWFVKLKYKDATDRVSQKLEGTRSN